MVLIHEAKLTVRDQMVKLEFILGSDYKVYFQIVIPTEPRGM